MSDKEFHNKHGRTEAHEKPAAAAATPPIAPRGFRAPKLETFSGKVEEHAGQNTITVTHKGESVRVSVPVNRAEFPPIGETVEVLTETITPPNGQAAYQRYYLAPEKKADEPAKK